MWLPSDQCTQAARLFSFLMLGERLAHDCAGLQAMIAPDAAARQFLVAQQRQEGYHAKIFQQAILWLTPRGSEACPALPPMTRYRSLLERALHRRELAETLLAQQVILEGLGDVIFQRISKGIAERGLGFARLRRLLLNQEHAHHSFGLRRLNQLVDGGAVSPDMLSDRAQEYLYLTHCMLAELGDLFVFFDEDPTAYVSELRRHLPRWIREHA